MKLIVCKFVALVAVAGAVVAVKDHKALRQGGVGGDKVDHHRQLVRKVGETCIDDPFDEGDYESVCDDGLLCENGKCCSTTDAHTRQFGDCNTDDDCCWDHQGCHKDGHCLQKEGQCYHDSDCSCDSCSAGQCACGGKYGGRRNIRRDLKLQVHHHKQTKHSLMCDEQIYKLYLGVSYAHTYFIAKPNSALIPTPNKNYNNKKFDETCESYTFDSGVDMNNDSLEKHIMVMMTNNIDSNDVDTAKDFLLLGEYKLSDVRDAFHKTKAGSEDGVKYDVINNNCATLLLGMFKRLGGTVTDEIITFVSNRLIRDANLIMPSLRDSIHKEDIMAIMEYKLMEESGDGSIGNSEAIPTSQMMFLNETFVIKTLVAHYIDQHDNVDIV